jgi:hypothetical protein
MLVRYLETAAEARWDGSVQVRQQQQLYGQVIFATGRVAWAVSRGQQETLGSLLWRLGYITKTQLDIVRSLYTAYEGRRKLGSILEECGFMSRAALRRAILLHTRAAIESLSMLDECRVIQIPGNIGDGEDMLFELREVVSATEVTGRGPGIQQPWSWQLWRTRGDENRVLEELAVLPGYQASGIFSADGCTLTAHVAQKGLEPIGLGVLLASVYDVTARDAPAAALKQAGGVTLVYNSGRLVSRIFDAGDRACILAVLAAPDTNCVAVGKQLERMMPAAREWARQYARPDQLKHLLKSLMRSADVETAVSAVEIALRERIRQARKQRAAPQTLALYAQALELLEQKSLNGALAVIERASTKD